MSGITIEKRSYSAKPWRLIDPDGREMFRMKPYPGHVDGHEMPPFWAPLAFDTKAEAITALGEMAWEAARTPDRTEGEP